MRSTANRWKLGLFVLLAGVAFVLGMTYVAWSRLQRDSQEFHAYFDEAVSGLVTGAPVKFRGVPIGEVRQIRVAPDKKMIHVRAALYDEDLSSLGLDSRRLAAGEPLPAGLRAQLVQSALTGTAFVQVDFFPNLPDAAPAWPFEVPVNTVQTVPSTFKSLEEGARDLVRTLPALAGAAEALLVQLRQDAAAADLPGLIARLGAAADGVQTLSAQLQGSGVPGEAKAALGELRQALADLREGKGPLGGAVARFGALAERAEQALVGVDVEETGRSLRAAADGVRRSSDDFGALAVELRGELQNLRRALQALEQLATTLERDPGAVLRGRAAGEPSPLGGGR